MDKADSATIHSSLAKHKGLLWDVNQKIFSNPELGYEEVKAHDALVEALQSTDGLRITPHSYGIATSFEAEYGSGGRVLTFNAEYDALPGIGHACGHNLIATVSLGAFFAVVDALKRSGKPGRVRILGTPAEETLGGKIKLIKAGAYKDVDACLMMHPGPEKAFAPYLGDAYDRTMAVAGMTITFKGKPAHAALSPWDGVNALDAVVAGYNSISLLRQQIQPDERIHGIITNGGQTNNVIPERAQVQYGVRAPTMARAEALMKRAVACFQGAAESTGCEMEVDMLQTYADLRTSIPICRAFQDAISSTGRTTMCNVNRSITPASTDQGNVSYECPSWHGLFGVPSENDAYPHTAGFAKGAGTEMAFQQAMWNCEGMALTGYRFLTDDDLAREVEEDFARQLGLPR